MKRCPQCNRVETDNALVFCRVDGASLVTDSGSVSGDDATVRFGSPPMATEAGTSVLPHHATDAGVGRPTGTTTVLDRQQTIGGTHELSKPKRTKVVVLAGAVIFITVLAVGAYFYVSRKTNAAIQSVAVLPFTNASGNSDIEYLSDGITESLINSLSQLPNLSVKARSTVFHYKGKDVTPQQAGTELSVQAVLNGRVMQRGDQLSLSLALVDARTGSQIWGEQYNRKTIDLAALQSEIARDVSNKLRTKLSGVEEQRVTKSYTADSEAYQLYLKGRFYWNKRTIDDFNRAIPYFQQAIDKDPNYALAYSGLADSYALLSVFEGPPKDWMPRAKAAAMKALALDNNLAEAHTSLAQIIAYYDWDFNAAEREFGRAIELNPNYATAHQWHAENLSSLQRHDEALSEMRRAVELDPLALITNRVYGDLLLNARRYDEAIEQYRKTIEMDPNFPTTHAFLGRAYEARQMYDQAVTEYLKFPGPGGFSPEGLTKMKEAYGKAGWNGFVQARLSELLARSKKDYVPEFILATWYARLGQKEEAFAWLEKAYQARDYRMTQLNVRNDLDSLRSDSRFADLVRRVGLPQ